MDVSRLPPEMFLTQVRTRVPRHFAARRGLATLGNRRLPERTMAILGGRLQRKNTAPLWHQKTREGWTIMAEAHALEDCLEPPQVALGKEP